MFRVSRDWRRIARNLVLFLFMGVLTLCFGQLASAEEPANGTAASPKEFQQVMADYALALGSDTLFEQVITMTDEELQMLYGAISDPDAAIDAMNAVIATPPPPKVQSAVAAMPLPETYFTPPYPTGDWYDTYTASLPVLGLLSDSDDADTELNNERCSANGESQMGIVVSVFDEARVGLQWACDTIVVLAGAGTNALACTAKGLAELGVVSTQIAIGQCSLQDALVDSAEIEASYENSLLTLSHLEDIQYALDYEVERRQVHLEIVELMAKREYLVSATVGGQPVEVHFIQILVSNQTGRVFEDLTNATQVTMISPGLHRVVINLPKNMRNPTFYNFHVMYDTEVDLFGTTLFDRRYLGSQ